MNTIAFYEILTRVPGTSKTEARKVADSIAHTDDVATKADIKDMATKFDIKDMATKADLAELEARLIGRIEQASNTQIRWVVGLAVVIIVAIFLK